MSEEEIKDIIEEILQDPFIVFSQDASFESTQIKATALQGLLDLYNKEKEKNKELETEYLIQRDLINPDFLKDYISKDKIKEEIKELENMKVGGEVFKTSVNFAKKILQELLED